MSGLVKAKKYDWKDSNLALFGSDTEKQVKKASAETEKAWQGAGQKPGLQIWRIVKFKVTHWPKDDYGQFYNGDSYIILNTYKEEDGDELLHDVHFWIGKYSSQDEYGTAAYKTVELDTFLDDKPVQHREVQGEESRLFKTYFPRIELLKGGAESGFRRVVPQQPTTRLLHFRGDRKKVQVKEIPAKKGNLNDEDVFIIDMYHELYQYNGNKANKDEKFKATQYVQQLKSDRAGKVKKFEALDSNTTPPNHHALMALKEGQSKPKAERKVSERKLFRLSDASGAMEFNEVASESDITRDSFESGDVFIFDRGDECFVWIGKEASVDERRNALTYGHNYLMKSEHPFLPLAVVGEGQKCKEFDSSF